MSHTRLFGALLPLGAVSAGLALETPFDARRVIDDQGDNPRTAIVFDLDLDGDNDVVAAILADNTFAWYENDGADDPTFTKRVLSSSAGGAREVWVADINRDGRPDVLGAARADNAVLWYRNEGGSPATFTEFTIAADVLSSWSVYAADIDGDGDLDVTSAGRDDDRISWHENDGADPPVWTKHVIDTDARRAQKAFADDVDSDGDMDMLSASGAGDEIAWYENDGADDPSFTKHSLTTSANNAKWVWTADLDRDGDTDILAAAETEATIEWFENDGGADPLFTRRTIATVGGAKACVPYDFDHDGDLDVLSNGIGLDHISIHENLGGAPLAWATHVVSTESDNPLTAFPGDLDGDGLADIVAASFEDDTIGWYPNAWIKPQQAFPAVLTLERYPASYDAFAYGDVNSDGQDDVVLSSASGEIGWAYIDAGGFPVFHPVATLASAAETALADLDRDGDRDVVVAALDGSVVLCASDGGAVPVFTTTTIATGLGALTGLAVGDINRDGAPDVVTTESGGTVSLLLSDGATPPVFSATTLDATALGARDPEVYDINQDGAPDVLVAAADLDRVIVYQHNGDAPPTFQRREMPDDIAGPWDLEVVDLNDDGADDVAVALIDGFTLHMMLNDGADDVTLSGFGWSASNLVAIDTGNPDFDELTDVVGFSLTDDTVRYGQNLGGDNPFVLFSSLPFTRTGTMDLAYEDFDHDGLPDIVLLSTGADTSTLSWVPNVGGQARVDPMAIANPEALVGRVEPLFMTYVHNLGDREDEPATLTRAQLRFLGSSGTPLTLAQAQALIQNVLVYADTNASGEFERLGDEVVFQSPIDALGAPGVFEIVIDPALNTYDIGPQGAGVYTVAVELAENAALAVPNQFSVEFFTAEVGDVIQVPHEVPLRLAESGGAVTALLTATIPAPGQILFGAPWIRHTIDNSLFGAEGPRGADVNGDGRTDFAVGWEQSHVSMLYLHPGEELVRHPWPSVRAGHAANVESAVPHDLDGDGRYEVLSALSAGPRTIRAHFPPSDPGQILNESMWSSQEFTQTPVDLWINVEPVDIDGQNGLDLVIGSIGRDGNFDAQIGWLRCPADPLDTSAWTYHHLIEVNWALALSGCDVDQDGDQDIIYSNRFGEAGAGGDDRGVFWLENPGHGAPTLTDPWVSHPIGSIGGEVGYLDLRRIGAGQLPQVVVPLRPRKTDIHTALDASGQTWDSVRLPWPDDMGTTKAARFADIDLDGHVDLVLTAVEAREDEGLVGLAWLRNPGDELGVGWNAYDIAGIEGEKFDIVAIEDVDNDGDMDVLASEEPDNAQGVFGLGFVWYENPAFQPTGDADRNGVTDAADLAAVLAEWGGVDFLATADFNYDGVVDSSDLAVVLALWQTQWGPPPTE